MREEYKEGLAIIALAVAAGSLAAWLSLPAWVSLFVTSLCGALLPITMLSRARKLQRVRRLQSREFIQRLIDVVPQPVYVKDDESRYLVVNQALANEKSSTIEAIVGRSSLNPLLSPERVRTVSEEDAAVLRGERIFKEECVPHLKTGEPRYKMVMKGSCIDTEGRRVIIGTNFDITQWRSSEKAKQARLQREQAQHEASWSFIQRVLDLIPHPIYVKDAQSRYLLLNKKLASHKGVPSKDLVGKTGLSEKAGPDTMLNHFVEDGEVLAGLIVHKETYKKHHITGEELYTVIDKGTCLDVEGNSVIVGAHFDVTGERNAELKLKEALAREKGLRERTHDFIQRVIDVIPDPVYIKSASSEFLMINKAFSAERKVVIGTRSWDDAPNRELAQITATEDAEVIAGGTVIKEQVIQHPTTGGELFRLIAKHRCINIDGSPVIVVIYFNITRWKVAERELQRLAQEDSLTGISNRRHFLAEGDRCLSRAGRHQEPVSLCIFDLDHFKQVNDKYGHQAGDEVLVEAVSRARECLRSYDVFARWGGEEFIVLLPLTSGEDAMVVAERIRLSICQTPFKTSNGEFSVSMSGGVAEHLVNESIEEMTARADEALYRAKESGRNMVIAAEAGPKIAISA